MDMSAFVRRRAEAITQQVKLEQLNGAMGVQL